MNEEKTIIDSYITIRGAAIAAKLRELRAEIEKLRAVFASVAPSNSKGYEGLLATGQKLIDLTNENERLREKEVWLDDHGETEKRQWKLLADKDAEIAKLKAEVKELENIVGARYFGDWRAKDAGRSAGEELGKGREPG